jgi:ParB family chromosome partitioning protein
VAKRRKKVDPTSRGLTPEEVQGAAEPKELSALEERVVAAGGRMIGAFRDPLGGHWQCLAALPLDAVAPTAFQRDLSKAHVENLSARIGELDRYLDPLVCVPAADGKTFETPNGHHRLAAMRALGARSIVVLLVPDRSVAYRILALNTEKAHNLKEKALEVIRMARDLAELDDAPEREYAELFEEPALVTLGPCYEANGRFAGSTYQPVLKRVESFLDEPLSDALGVRAARAETLLALDAAVADAVGALKERGFDSPYLKAFVVARINPLRSGKVDEVPDWDATIGKMLEGARAFDASKVKADQVTRSGGPADE